MDLRSLIRRSKFLVLFSADAVVRITRPRRPRSKSVLIVRLDAIGDFVLWLDAAQALVSHYRQQGAASVLVGNRVWTEWASELGIFDRVIAIDPLKYQRNLRYRFHVAREIRRLGCTNAINPTYSRNWLLDDSVIHISGADERVGSVGDASNSSLWQLRIANSWYSRQVPASSDPLTELERNAEFIRNLTDPSFPTRLPLLEHLATGPLSQEFSQATGNRPYYVLFPGASWSGREWPAARFQAIAERLFQKTGWVGVVCGGPSDKRLGQEISEGGVAPIVDWTGRTTLSQLATVLSNARAVFANETSAAHIGAISGVPTICILGGGHYGRFLPYKTDADAVRVLPRTITHPMPCFGCNWKCIHERSECGPVACIDRIDTEAVWQEACSLLGLE